MQVSILQFAQIAVDGRLRGAQLCRHLADRAFHVEDARLLQVFHDADLLVHRQLVGRQSAAVTSVMAACTASGRLLTKFSTPTLGPGS